MSANFVAPGTVVEVIAPSGVEALRGIAMVSADAGALFPLKVEGVFELPKLSATSGQEFAAGDAVYTDGLGMPAPRRRVSLKSASLMTRQTRPPQC